MNKSLINTAVGTALGVGAMAASTAATAGVLSYDWDGVFTMLDPDGAALFNSSIPAKGNNQFHTPISGTIQFDTVTGAGTGTLVPFDFFSNDPALPLEVEGISLQAIGDGMGGPGTLVLGNLLFSWTGTVGIPVSLVLDASGFFAGETSSGGPAGAIPASDGTYVGATVPGAVTGPGGYAGYLGLGPVPIATTAWNTTSNCARPGVVNDGACLGLATSGVLPMVFDTAANPNDFVPNTGGNIGGNPMIDGPFAGSNANFNITLLTNEVFDPDGFIPPNCDFDPSGVLCTPPIPIPATVWLFGSGLLGLVGLARQRKY